ncbi:MAG TPA: amphi-Trp domain-containing protein [Micavibrio sp.]
MADKPGRDVEVEYSVSEFADKLRRLADCLEQGKPFEIQIAGERIYVPVRAAFNIEHEREGAEEEIEFQLKWTNE